MELLSRDFDDPILLVPPIAGGDGETEGVEGAETDGEPAGDETSGADSGEESEQPPQDGEEQVPGEQDPQQQEQDGQPQAGGGYDDGQGGRMPQSVPYSRFKEINDRLRAVDAERTMLLGRVTSPGGQPNGQSGAQPGPREVPEQYRELDKGMGGYMRHYLDPIAEVVMDMRSQMADSKDESSFYRGIGRTLNEQQADLVEQAREALSQKMRQPVERADALLFLRGHPTHGKLFVNQQARQEQQLANGVATARRQAGQVGGRKPVARTATPGTVDLNTLPRSQRVKVFEQAMGNTPV